MAEPKTQMPPQDQTSPPPPWVVELIRALKPQGPLEMAGLTAEHIERITKPPAPQRFRKILWRSEETGATGVAHVVESRKFPHGRITAIESYTHPAEAYTHESEGGKVPDGFHMWAGQQRTIPEGQEPHVGDLNQAFKQWRYETFYQADLRFYNGREVKAACCAEEGPGLGLKTPWETSKVGAVSEA
jgi:hypothetical protein